ncbi:MAG: hypothetical protein EBV03_10280 [Proteobacteria bacterium]|nr:hypothetical protein [Pseudomonadota bacterium]
MPEKDPEISRREFLRSAAKRTAAVGGGIALTGALAYLVPLAVYPEDYRPAGDENATLTQAAVNAQYNQLYQQMKDAQQRARKSGKKLVVLVGEHHEYSLSLLHKLMVADIASRLGVKEMVHETSTDLVELSQNHRLMMEKVRAILQEKGTYRNKPYGALLEAYDTLPEQEKKDVDMACTMSIIVPQYNKGKQHATAQFQSAVGQRLTLINGEGLDPRYTSTAERLQPKCEDKMAQCVQERPGDCVAGYGLTHVLPIRRALKADPKVELLTLDATNLKLSGVRHQLGPSDRMALTRRNAEVEAMLDEPDVTRLVLNGAPPSYGRAHEMVMTSSFQHRCKTPGIPDAISEERAKLLQGMLAEVTGEYADKEKSAKNR